MSSDQVSALMNEAVRLDREGKYAEAEARYTQAIHILRGTLAGGSITEANRNAVMSYMSNVAKRVQQMRVLGRTGASTSAPPKPTAKAANSKNSSSAGAEDDWISGLGVPHTELPTAGPTPRAGKKDAPHKDSPKKSSSTDKPAPNRVAPPPPVARPPGLRDLYAPRTSDRVLKAIEVATALSKQGELKRAVDVLQHAYTVGRRERNNPSNFADIEDILKFMRQRYYEQYPPRFLQDNPVLPDEISLLRKSGITATLLLPIWDDVSEGYGAENVFMPSEGVWEDSFPLRLGPRQVKAGAKLLRPTEVLDRKLEDYAIIHAADPLNIKQTVVSDCSMVCSLIICASYQKRFPNAKIISNVIYPQDQEGNPILNPKGKHCVKMLINGITRLVTIDDRLPINPHTKQLLCTYSRDPAELWVSLMEKAFVKTCGGSYDFPGSNSSSDLYKLSGWLPDSISFGAKDMDPNYQWKRLAHSFKLGAVLLTISTPAVMDAATGSTLKLTSGHAYAVIDVREVEERRVFMVRNPWSTFSWGGELSFNDKSEATAKVHAALDYTSELSELGVFCISWEDVVKYFDRCSLSWNPYMLYQNAEGLPRRPVRIACHGTFEYTTSMGLSPQLHLGVVQATRRTRMHLVISRHITDVTEFGLQFEKNNPKVPYIALKLYNITGYDSVTQCLGEKCAFGACRCRRLTSTSDLPTRLQPLNEVTFRNNSAHTVSFDCPAGTSNMVVVLSRLESTEHEPFNYTITLHTELDMMRLPRSAKPEPQPSLRHERSTLLDANLDAGNPHSGVFMHAIPLASLRHSSRVPGEWVKGRSCGGRCSMNTFVFNPQYRLLLREPAHIAVRLSVDQCPESCMVHLVRRKVGESSGSDGSGSSKLSFRARVGNPNKECDFVMQARLYGHGGATLDSALPQTLSADTNRILGARAVIQEAQRICVKVIGAGGPTAAVGEFVVYDVEEEDEAGVLLLSAVANGFTASPVQSSLIVSGKQVPHTVRLRQLIALTDQASNRGGAGEENGKGSDVEVRLVLGETSKLSFPSSTAAGDVFAEVQGVCKNVVTSSSQMMSFVRTLSNLLQQVQDLDADKRDYLTDLCRYIVEYLNRASNEVRPPPPPAQCLPPLPAGEYILIPSAWKKGVPGNYELIVETTKPHALHPIPAEGEGLIEKRISAELLTTGTGLRGQCKPPLRVPKNDAYFRNSKVSISTPVRALFTCRLLMLDQGDGEGGRDTGASVNVSLFRNRDESSMEMVGNSGSYTSYGVSIDPVSLEPQVTYLLVVSSNAPSTAKYLLRIYSDVNLSPQLTQ